MKAERWKEIERLYHEALERPSTERASFLKAACGGDDALRQEVESLLGYQPAAENFIETPAPERAAKDLSGEAADLSPLTAKAIQVIGKTIAHYYVLEMLGSGG